MSFIRKLLILIYTLTAIVHTILLNVDHGRGYLGFTMIIPLIRVLIYHPITRQKLQKEAFGLLTPPLKAVLFTLLFPIILGLLLHMYLQTQNTSFLYDHPTDFIRLVLIGITISSLSALLEEMVWRGYVYHYLRSFYSLKKTAMIIGALWSFWHLPVALLYKHYDSPFLGTIIFLLLLFSISILLTYVRADGQSVIPAALLHGMLNVFVLTDGVKNEGGSAEIEFIKLLLLVLLVAMVGAAYFRRISRFVTKNETQ